MSIFTWPLSTLAAVAVAVAWLGASLARAGADGALATVSVATQLDAPAADPLKLATAVIDVAPLVTEETLVEWASRVASMTSDLPFTRRHEDASPFLVIGVKSSVLHHFPQRQAIRATWANASTLRSLSVRIVFLGCETDLSPFTDATDRAAVMDAIAREKEVFGDLLTSELDCVDSYAQLLRKTVNFLHWIASTSLHTARFVMVADDDVYVDIARLVDKLKQHTSARRFYGGFVFRDFEPKRDPAHKNAIPEHEYPMATLPPFAGGPHYVLSMDAVNYISRNRNQLRGLRALDDVSIALWLLAIQTHPVHIPEFILLRSSPCHDQAIALADLSPSSVIHVHENVLQNRSVCVGLTNTTAIRRHRGIVLPSTDEGTGAGGGNAMLEWELFHNATTYAAHVGVTITVATHQVSYQYVPSAATYETGLCQPGAQLLLSQLYVNVGAAFCEYHRRKLLAFIEDTNRNTHALVALPRHNLAVRDRTVVRVGLSQGARYARVLLECLLVQIYPSSPILVLTQDALDVSGEPPPDLFIFSILDEDSNDGVPDGARYIAQYGAHSQMLMISGEAWLPKQLHSAVILISTVSSQHHPKHLHLPVASSAFAEILEHSPLDLLCSFAERANESDPSRRRFCVYLYARCDRLRREYMFDLLNDIEPVDALGACQGARQYPNPRQSQERYYDPFYTDLAIAKYTDYKFVIAFENAVVPGYVTEKIVTAFLAGAIPVYWGHSPTVTRVFNRKAFINCADYESLRACAQRVIAVYRSPTEYEAMRRQAPIVDETAFRDMFAWHPAVMKSGISPLAQDLERLLQSKELIIGA